MSHQHPIDFDVVISGSGLVGASVAIGLADRGFRVGIIEPTQRTQQAQPSHDDRTLVLNRASLNILSHLDLMPSKLGRVPIETIVINRLGGLGHITLKADDHADSMPIDETYPQPHFGQVIVARELGQVMLERLNQHTHITQFCPQSLVSADLKSEAVFSTLDDGTVLSSRILIGADGTHSPLRQHLGLGIDHHDYGQSAMIFSVQATQPILGCAFERFTPQGPLAMLPQPNGRYGVVWVDQQAGIDEAMSWSDQALMERLGQRFSRHLKPFHSPSKRACYPLVKQQVTEPVLGRVVLVGNAANTVHPVSAQGFNLGLRDVGALVDALGSPPATAAESDRWDEALASYQRIRAHDQQSTVHYTDTLARGFAHPLSPVRLLSGLGLVAHRFSGTLERRLVRAAMGFREPISSLAQFEGDR